MYLWARINSLGTGSSFFFCKWIGVKTSVSRRSILFQECILYIHQFDIFFVHKIHENLFDLSFLANIRELVLNCLIKVCLLSEINVFRHIFMSFLSREKKRVCGQQNLANRLTSTVFFFFNFSLFCLCCILFCLVHKINLT